MSPSREPNENDISIDDDDILALEQLLAEVDAEVAKKVQTKEAKVTIENTAPETEKKMIPRLREDSSFAEAFGYDDNLPPSKQREAEASAAAAKADDLDSSDDEEVKNFLERKYNEYGCDINKRLKQDKETKFESRVAREVDAAINVTKKGAPVEPFPAASHVKNPHNPLQRQSHLSNSFQKTVAPQVRNVAPVLPAQAPTSTVFTDPVFGLRIVKPLVSSALLVERMAGRKAVPFSGIAFHTQQGDLTKDWVIAGVLVNKSPVKMSKTGSPYSIWRVSDLRGEVKMISMFLFRTAHKELWKTAEGTCLAILNASVLEKRAESSDAACLSIDTAQKVMILGTSKDMGVCKATKRNGDKCTTFVNLSECDFCIFHMKQEFSKMSQRSELQSPNAGRGTNELRNKVLGKSEVFYGGQSFSAVPAKRSAKLTAKDNLRISTLSEYAVSPLARSVNHASKPKTACSDIPYAQRVGPFSKVACTIDASVKQRVLDLERLKKLQVETQSAPSAKDAAIAKEKDTLNASLPSGSASAKETVIAMEKDALNASLPSTSASAAALSSPSTPPAKSIPDKFKDRGFSFTTQSPQLSRENFSIEVNIGNRQAQLAKQNAKQVLKKRPIEKVNPNSIRGSAQGKRRAIDDLNEKFGSDTKRQKLEEDQREQDRKSRLQRIIEAASSHANLVDLREQQEQDKYFSKQEKKEALEEKMLKTFKVPCKAVICQRCKYTAFSAADRCKEERHPLKVIDAEKRFFQCRDCSNRTATVFKMPKTSCSNCKGSRWERTAMIRERKLCNTAEGLSVRGDEETFVGSLAGGANLNLLVPDESG